MRRCRGDTLHLFHYNRDTCNRQYVGVEHCMKICLLNRWNPQLIKGGIETYLLYLARYFSERGHQVVLAYPRKQTTNLLRPIRWAILKSLRIDVSEALDSIEVASDAAKVDADIYHGQAQHSFGLTLFQRMRLATRRPLVSTAHGSTWGVLNSLGYLSLGEKRVTLSMERVAFNNSDKVICVSQSVKDELIEGYATKPDRLTVIHNGIDPRRYGAKNWAKQQLYGRDNTVIVTFFLKGGVRKGSYTGCKILHLLETKSAKNLLIQAIVDKATMNSLQHYESQYLKLYEDPGEKLLADLFSASDVFVFPTRYEGFSFTLLEAMAARNAILTSDIGASREAIDEGIQGYLLNPAETTTWIDCIVHLCEDEETLRKMQKRAFETVESRFNSQTMCKRTLALYESLL